MDCNSDKNISISTPVFVRWLIIKFAEPVCSILSQAMYVVPGSPDCDTVFALYKKKLFETPFIPFVPEIPLVPEVPLPSTISDEVGII